MTVHQLPSADTLAHSVGVNRYVAGSMSEVEMQAFEVELMRSPSLQLDVEAELALREHADVFAPDADFVAAPVNLDRAGQLAHAGIERTPLRPRHNGVMAFAIAASVMAGWFLNTLLGKEFALPGESLALVEITEPRGPAASNLVPARRPFIARLLTADDVLHSVMLKDRSGRTLQAWTALKPAGDGYLSLIFPPLDPTRSPFQVHLRSASGFAQDLQLTVGEIPTP